jgi:hypothetical protein
VFISLYIGRNVCRDKCELSIRSLIRWEIHWHRNYRTVARVHVSRFPSCCIDFDQLTRELSRLF